MNNILSSFIGFIILFAWFSNIVLLYLVDRFLIKGRNNKTKLNKTSYRFLLSFSSCIFLIIASLILSNLIVTGTSFIIGITISYLFQIIGFLIISISGIKLSYEVIIFTCNKKKSKETINPININSIRKKIVKSICYFINGIGIYSVIVLLVPIEFFSPELAIVIPQISLFLIFIFILNTLIILKLTPRSYDDTKKSKFSFLRIKSIAKRKHFRQGILVMGILLSFIFSLPILSTPFSIIHAENEFRDVYGDNWRNFIPSNISRFFLESQFNIYNYFMGIPHKDCNIELDILYYEKNDTKLYLDVYYPKVSGESLPGNNSIIIKIHGGAWKVGDKGTGNTPIISKYLANQGYVVFDIQYGLMEFQNGGLDLTPEYVQGNFTLHDMVYQIGNFTKQLETTYASEYNGNLDSVFIMGGSAGGHLTSVIGLGYNDPYFSGNFSNAIKLKGIIPLYPPNSAEHYFNRFEFKDLIPGDPTTNPLAFKKFTPSNLVSLNDPPALIFQGTQDRLVPPINSEQIEKAIEGIGNDCIRLIFYFATHCNDMITNNNFAQIWLYYLERFLFLNR
ncbi:MAG: alpha/beta hydrolase [Candidatus Lokiarchaeota archaeon]|nr:alpha/beta hydrolase [Candidatus Lokiarchaeota archaeon]